MAVQLPAHLQTRPYQQSPTDRATDGIGAALPPHISIQSNAFALIDATGAVTEIDTPYLDVCIIDICDVMCKMYFGKDWEPNSNDAPLCFSMNGVAPSKDAIQPQARTCAECPKNERGSAVSKLSGVAIKACRDEKKLAVLIEGYDMVFQVTITPGHFKNWQSYYEKFKGQTFKAEDLWTRLSFERGKSGVLFFGARPVVQGGPSVWIDEKTAALRNEAILTKKTDLYVGRLDRPREGALPAPAAQRQIEAPAAQSFPATNTTQQQTPASVASPASAEPEPARRRRRTAAQIAADEAAQKAPTQQPVSAQPQQAPFAMSTLPQPNGGEAPFGIASGVAPNPELAATLDSIFK